MATTSKTKRISGASAKPQTMSIQDKARMAVRPSVNAAAVIKVFQGNVMGKDADMNTLIDELKNTVGEVKGGDLHTLEAMLVAQATALQTMFTSLARRAQA